MVSDTTGRPVITGMVPAGQASAGVREIRIVGTNLGMSGTDTNWILFGGVRPIIKEIQDSYVTIYRPQLSTDHYGGKPSIVSVTNPKMAYAPSHTTYYVESPGAFVGSYPTATFASIVAAECDNQPQENLYTTTPTKFMYKTDFSGVTQINVLTPPILIGSEFATIGAMSFGPGVRKQNLFIAAGKNYISRLYVADTISASTNKITKLAVPTTVTQLDFDEKGNLYVGGYDAVSLSGKLYVADSSVGSSVPAFTPMTGYTGGANIIKIRVVKESGNDYLYVADSLSIWKGQISGNSLTNPQVVVNLAGTALSACRITSFALDEHSSIFLCLKNSPNYSLFIKENDGSVTPFYQDSTILPNTVDKLMWGNSNFLYLISSSLTGSNASNKIYRLTLDYSDGTPRKGAPYYGRTFIR